MDRLCYSVVDAGEVPVTEKLLEDDLLVVPVILVDEQTGKMECTDLYRLWSSARNPDSVLYECRGNTVDYAHEYVRLFIGGVPRMVSHQALKEIVYSIQMRGTWPFVLVVTRTDRQFPVQSKRYLEQISTSTTPYTGGAAINCQPDTKQYVNSLQLLEDKESLQKRVNFDEILQVYLREKKLETMPTKQDVIQATLQTMAAQPIGGGASVTISNGISSKNLEFTKSGENTFTLRDRNTSMSPSDIAALLGKAPYIREVAFPPHILWSYLRPELFELR